MKSVERWQTDKQTNTQTHTHTYILSKNWGNLFLPPSFFYFYFSNSLNAKKAVSNSVCTYCKDVIVVGDLNIHFDVTTNSVTILLYLGGGRGICMQNILTREPVIPLFSKGPSEIRFYWPFFKLFEYSFTVVTLTSKLLLRVYGWRISMDAEWWEGSEKLHHYNFRRWKSRNKRKKNTKKRVSRSEKMTNLW